MKRLNGSLFVRHRTHVVNVFYDAIDPLISDAIISVNFRWGYTNKFSKRVWQICNVYVRKCGAKIVTKNRMLKRLAVADLNVKFEVSRFHLDVTRVS